MYGVFLDRPYRYLIFFGDKRHSTVPSGPLLSPLSSCRPPHGSRPLSARGLSYNFQDLNLTALVLDMHLSTLDFVRCLERSREGGEPLGCKCTHSLDYLELVGSQLVHPNVKHARSH